MSIADQLRDKLNKQLAAVDEHLNAAQAEARARKAQAEADAAGAELEEELLAKVNQLKGKLAEGQVYLQELAEAGDEKADEIKARITDFFDD